MHFDSNLSPNAYRAQFLMTEFAFLIPSPMTRRKSTRYLVMIVSEQPSK